MTVPKTALQLRHAEQASSPKYGNGLEGLPNMAMDSQRWQGTLLFGRAQLFGSGGRKALASCQLAGSLAELSLGRLISSQLAPG